MSKKLIFFQKLSFLDNFEETCNLFKNKSIEKKSFFDKLVKKGLYDGTIKVIKSYSLINKSLSLSLGKSSFFDLIFSKEKNLLVCPALAVNAILEVDDCLIFIKRKKEFYSCPGYFDFPAGLVPIRKSILERLENRIEEEVGLSKREIEIKENFNFAILFEKEAFNLFFRVKCKKTKEEVEKLFLDNNKGTSPFLLPRKEIPSFFNKNKKAVFSEILNFI
jgi:8-oxo-dGTP pyrophosphatase MutT (NUDIX family)